MKRLTTLTLTALLSLTTVAAAQPKAKPTAPTAPAKPVRVIEITDGDDITGDRPSGELVPIGIRETAKSSSLIRIRYDFIDLIVKAADAV